MAEENRRETEGIVPEVQGMFTSDAALQEAIARLTGAGFDRADFRMPAAPRRPGEATKEEAETPPISEADARQARTLHTSTAASVGALAAAGATVATGGAAALAAAAAVAGGVGAGLLTKAATDTSSELEHEDRDAAAKKGELVLGVRAETPERRAQAEALLRAAGAAWVTVAGRGDHAIDSARWTG
jgi:hypothetical protein